MHFDDDSGDSLVCQDSASLSPDCFSLRTIERYSQSFDFELMIEAGAGARALFLIFPTFKYNKADRSHYGSERVRVSNVLLVRTT